MTAMASPSPPPPASGNPLLLARWLFAVAAMVVIIVLVGGITRLTESGLSITEWEPFTGILPPIGEAAWEAEFVKYRATPEFIYEAGPAGMTLSDFKFIFFWEWFHRIWGRLIGLAFLLPMVWFWLRGAIPAGYKWRLFAVFALICLQGAIGWVMVASGLIGQMTDVSHFKLSAHLLTAFIILGGLVWTALDLKALAANPAAKPSRISGFGWIVAAIVFMQMLLGAWVAGLNAGHASYSWPLMNGQFMPEIDLQKGWFWAATHDPFFIHFLHRWWAWVAVIALIWLARRVRQDKRAASIAIHSAFGTQILLGIATVLTEISLWVAVSHQVVGALLVAALTWGLHVEGQSSRAPA